MHKDHSPPVLPTVETPGFRPPDTPQSPLSPLSPLSPPTGTASVNATQTGAQLRAQSSFRRHQRKRSSTIFVQPRLAPPVVKVEEAPLATGLVRGVTTLAGAQLLAKLLAFVLNQLLIRFLGARELGAASQLDLLVGTALALSRDALRLSSQRLTATRLNHKSEYTTDGRAVLGTVLGCSQETINLGWLAVSLGTTVVLLISCFLIIRGIWPLPVVTVAAAAAVIELAAEPCFLLNQLKLKLEQRARAESAANAVRVIVVAAGLLILHISPFLGFAIGHLAFAITLATVYYVATLKSARDDGFSLLPQRVWADQGQHEIVYISEPLWHTSLELGIQQLMKFFLTEGDKLAVGIMTALEEQGQYALAGNYGSLLARLVFLPIEEALRGYFTRVFPKEQLSELKSAYPFPKEDSRENTEIDCAIQDDKDHDPTNLKTTVSQAVHHDDADRKKANDNVSVLTAVLRAYSYLGILATGFGPLVAGYVLSFVVRSSRFGNAAAVLAAYACYIPVLAWNGVLESLVQSVASLHTLRIQGGVLAGIALLFVALTYIFVSVAKLGAVGIVWAQIIAMAVRATWNLRFTTVYFKRYFNLNLNWLLTCLPQWWIGVESAVCVGIAWYGVGEVHTFRQFVLICMLASFVLVSILISERSTIAKLQAKIRGKSHTPSSPSSHTQLKFKHE